MTSATAPTTRSALTTASPEMLTAVLDQSMDCIKVIDAAGRLTFMNRNGMCAMEVDEFSMVDGASWATFWPEETQPRIEAGLAAAREGRATRFEAFCPTAKGTPKWWEVSISPLIGMDGEAAFFVATSRDITERTHAATLREAVADEMRHRLRNSYAVASGLLSAHARADATLQPFVSDMLARFSALGIAQAANCDAVTSDFADLLPRLAEGYATPLCPITFRSLPSISLDQRRLDALAVVVGELAVNSIKHGALGHGGSIAIDGARDGEAVTWTWRERSDRPVESTSRDGGQGLTLIRRVLSAISGTVQTDWADDGLDVTVTFAAA